VPFKTPVWRHYETSQDEPWEVQARLPPQGGCASSEYRGRAHARWYPVVMPCYSPLRAYMGPIGANGKRKIAFGPSGGVVVGNAVDLPCGQCIGCALERSRQWAVRIMHEASLHDHNCFITLTYERNPIDLDIRHVQQFYKRLRKLHRVRHFSCGEYGTLNKRPHYHACIFGYDFPDKVPHEVNNGNQLFVSSELSRLWGWGFCTVGSLTFDSAAYVARYCLKKQAGSSSQNPWERVDPLTGEITTVSSEYVHMSNRPGIGAGWIKKWTSDVYPSDEVIVRGHSCKPPRYYDKYLEGIDFALARQLKNLRALDMHVDPKDSIDFHRAGISKRSQIQSLSRPL